MPGPVELTKVGQSRQKCGTWIPAYPVDESSHASPTSGGFHTSIGRDSFKHLTVRFFDKDGRQMYFYRKSDKSFWDVLHVPEDTAENKAIWRIEDDYETITEAEYRV